MPYDAPHSFVAAADSDYYSVEFAVAAFVVTDVVSNSVAHAFQRVVVPAKEHCLVEEA